MAENSMKPRIRFKGYTDAWEQRKLGELGFFKSNGVDKKINPNEVFVNLLNYMDVYNRRHITAKNCVELMQVTAKPQQVKDNDVQANDVFFTPTSETADDIGHVLVIEETLPNTVYSYHLMRYRPFDGKFYPTFPNYEFESGFVRYQIVLNAQGVQRFVLNREAFEQLEIRKPDYAEQEKISKFLSQLDNMSVLYQQKHDKILNIKKALLEKMFPSDTETTPKIRFKGVNDAWEQRKLGEVANIQKGQQLGKAEMSNNGAFYVLNGGMEPSGYTNQYNTFANTISISEGGNSCGYVSLNLEQFWSGGHNYTLQNPKIDTFFLYQWLKRHEKGIMALRVGSGLPNIQKSALQDVNVAYPKKSEQRAIAEILNKIDNLITLHQRQLEKLKNIKSALLEKMFV